jgi:serine/threonine protein kinase
MRNYLLCYYLWANVSNVQIRRLQFVHSRNFIHRDLKPSNIIMGVGKHANLVHIIDFGLSKEFRHPDTHQHIPYNNSLSFAGTPTFASIPSHLGLELGRRDDLESLAYLLIHFLHGSLPWQGLEFGKHDLVVESKQNTPMYDLCSTLPVELRVFLEYSCSLSFDKKPDYGYVCDVFDGLLSWEEITTELTFDWDIPNSPVNGEPSSPGGK